MTQATLKQLKDSHSPSMTDEDFIKMLAASNNITLSKNEKGELKVAEENEIKEAHPNLIKPDQTNTGYLGSYATQHLTEAGNLKGIAHDTVDAIGAVIKAPFSLWDKGVSAAEDTATTVMKWFDDDATPVYLASIKSGVTPPRTPLGRILGVAGEVGAATVLTGGGSGAAILTQGTAKAGMMGAGKALAPAMLQAGPKTVTALQTAAAAARNTAIDFIVSNPDDKNMAAELQEVINKPWLSVLATEPTDSRIVRRYKHMVDGFVIGELAFPSLVKLAKVGGRAVTKLAGKLPKAAPAEDILPDSISKSMGDFASGIPDFDVMSPMKKQLIEQGADPLTATKTVNLIESWAINSKRGNEPLEDFISARNITFIKDKNTVNKKGFIDLPAIGTPFTKDAPANITITLGENGDESTIIHEIGHLFLWDKFDRAAKGMLKEGETTELSALKKLIGWKNGQKAVTISQQERYAKSFEQWFQTGTAPKGMEESFQSFQKQLQDIYSDALVTGAELPQEYNNLFGKMLGRADTDPDRLKLYQLGLNPEKEAEAIISAGRSKGQADYGYTVNPCRLTGEDRRLHLRHLTDELNKLSPVPDEITRIHNVSEMDMLSREVVNKLVGTGSDGIATRQRIIDAVNSSKSWIAFDRACEYMIYQCSEQLAPLYEQLDDISDDTARTIVKGRIFAQMQEQVFYRNSKAQLTATAARLLEGKKHQLTNMTALDTLLKESADDVMRASSSLTHNQPTPSSLAPDELFSSPLLKEIPKEILDNGDAASIKKIFAEIGEDKVDAIIQSGKLHMGDLQNASMVFDFMARDWKDKGFDTLKEIYLSNLLSNPATWGVNAISNAIKATVTPLEYMIEGAARYGIGKSAAFMGIEDFAKRVNLDSDYGAETFRLGINVYNSYSLFVKDAWNIAARAFKSGKALAGDSVAFVEEYRPARMLSTEAWGLNHATMGGWALDGIGQIVNLPSRILMSTDQFFKVLAGRGGVYAEIVEEAIARGIPKIQLTDYIDAELSKRVVQKLSNGQLTAELYLSDSVRDFVKEQTFTQDAGAITQAMMKLRNTVPPLYAIFPFIQTPVNIVKDTLAHLPYIAGGRIIYEGATNLKYLMSKNSQIIRQGGMARSKLLGQFAIASSLWTLGINLAQEGRLTGSGPKNPSAKKTKEELGWQSHSVQMGNTWYSYDPLDPFGTVLSMAADVNELSTMLSDEEKDTEEYISVCQAMISSLANNLGDKTYLMSLGRLLNAINDPDRSGHYLAKIATDIPTNLLIPRVVTNVARDTGISDPYMKEVRSCLDAFYNRVPGLSDSLPTQFSWLTGKPREYSPYASLNRFYTKSAESDLPDKLTTGLTGLDRVLSGPSDLVNGQKLSGEQYSRYCQLNATVQIADQTLLEALNDVVSSPRYLDGGSDEKAKILRSTIGHYRNAAKEQLLEEYPELEGKIRPSTTQSELDDLLAYGKR